MPNLRKMFTPDPGMTLFEVDLKGADARVVAWEADDKPLKDAFRQGVDIHAFNAETIWRHNAALSEYKKPPLERFRQKAKIAVHAVDYGCKERTLADHLGISVSEAGAFIEKWFYIHPGIKSWHSRTDNKLRREKRVSNVWGYNRPYFDRLDNILPEALAWIGQSTTAIAINRLIVKLEREVKDIDILLQTHDSVTFQLPTCGLKSRMPELMPLFEVIVPYDDPLVMPCDVKTTTTSWGELD